jgi:hypothetical protein
MISHIEPNTIQQIAPISKALASLSPLSSVVDDLDKLVRNDFESLRDSYFAGLVVATIAVVIGVVLEEAEEWVPYIKRVLPLQPITEYRLTKKLAKLGWLLIVVGVAGEGIFEVLVSRADGIVHTFEEIRLNEARKQAGDAKSSALVARNAASKAQEKAEAAETSAIRTGKLATQAQLDAHSAQEYAESLRTEVDFFKLEASASISGHVFLPSTFKYALKLGSGAEIDITAVDGVGTKAVAFTANLVRVFENSKWKIFHTRMTAGQGVVIHNKWVSSTPIEGPMTPAGVRADPNAYEIDVDLAADRLVLLSNKKLSVGEANVLAALSGALHAELKQDPDGDFPGDRIRIIIGDP